MRSICALLLVGMAGVFIFQRSGHTQTTATADQSEYIFRFNTGISGVFLSSMSFPQQQSIDLGSCTATEKINGPLICAVNCSNQSVCLLDLTGPSGSSVNDVLEKVSETPTNSQAGTAASPSPTASTNPSVNPGLYGAMLFEKSPDSSSSLQMRVEAFNSVK